jgi:hypothetical protein
MAEGGLKRVLTQRRVRPQLAEQQGLSEDLKDSQVLPQPDNWRQWLWQEELCNSGSQGRLQHAQHILVHCVQPGSNSQRWM